MKRYAIWNKKDNIITPVGEILTPDEWIARHPAAGGNVTVLCSPGEVNGGYFGILSSLVVDYEAEGCDFSACTTDEEKLAVIEAFDDARAAKIAEEIAQEKVNSAVQADALASIAASLEYQNLMTLPDVEG